MKARIFTEVEATTIICPMKECGYCDGSLCALFNFVESAVIDAETVNVFCCGLNNGS